jgi:hypothetical protein
MKEGKQWLRTNDKEAIFIEFSPQKPINFAFLFFQGIFSKNAFLTILLSRSEILKRQNKMPYNFNCSHLSDHQKMISRNKVTDVSKVEKNWRTLYGFFWQTSYFKIRRGI